MKAFSIHKISPAVIATICATVVFIGATTYRLEQTGLYYDELHQATGSFAYVGRPSLMFSLLPIRGLPLLNMTYSAAIKSAIYGLYLRASGYPFSIISWRLLGIIFCVAGIVAFGMLAGQRLPTPALILFLCLLLTDTNFLLQSRHDWGPVALAFLFRMVFVGVWLRQVDKPGHRQVFFVLGLIVGIAIFEKLSSAVVLGPLVVMLLGDSQKRTARDFVSALAGVCLGTSPIVATNIYSFIVGSRLPVLASPPASEDSLVEYAANYLTVGNGAAERGFIFATSSFPWAVWVEGFALVSLMLLVGIVAWKRIQVDRAARIAGLALISYIAVGIGLRLLPAATAENHWIIGTPFQYVAIAYACAAVWPFTGNSMRVMRLLCFACIVVLLSVRIPALVSVYEAIRDDKYAAPWDPSVNTAAAFIARQPENTVFIAADWGIATQVFCLANGRQNFVFEPFWSDEARIALKQHLDDPERDLLLVAAPKPRPLVHREATKQVFDDLASSPNWVEIPIDPAVQNLRSIELHAFRRTRTSAAGGKL